MNDKTLLELAAKAAGIEEYEVVSRKGCTQVHITHRWESYDGPETGLEIWNPLTDDGDALRLAVKLNLSIVIDDTYQVNVGRYDFKEDIVAVIKKDPYAATRRAIVRAAAEIGKEMKS